MNSRTQLIAAQCPGRDSNSQAVSTAGDFETPSNVFPGNDLASGANGAQSTEVPQSISKSHLSATPVCYTPSEKNRRCARCKRELNLSAFGLRTKRGKRVPQPYCRECMVSYHAEWRVTERGREKFAAKQNESKQRHPERRRAREAVNNAIKSGRLTRGLCELAGTDCHGTIDAHHDDYSKPLEVRWACKRHHAVLDARRRGAA